MSVSRFAAVGALWLTIGLVSVCTEARAVDVFTGTISIDADEVTLTSCDRSRSTYVLRDAERVTAVAQLHKRSAGQGFWYAEVSGEYARIDGGDGIRVVSIDTLLAGRGCEMAG
jgi:hypothetical protein